MIFKDDKVYNIIKWICLTVVPALNVLITTLCGIYGWTWGNIVIGTIDAFAIFVGAILGFGSIKYQKLNATKKVK
jgi:hypothetical protein